MNIFWLKKFKPTQLSSPLLSYFHHAKRVLKRDITLLRKNFLGNAMNSFFKSYSTTKSLPFVISEPWKYRVITPRGPTSTAITGRRSSLRPSTTGGGKPIGYLTKFPQQNTLLVRVFTINC